MIRSRFSIASMASLALATAAAAGIAPHMTNKLLPPGVVPEDEFATSLDLDGDVAVVGAPLDDETAEDAGAAYVYRRINGAWTLEAKLLASNGAADDEFGRAVAVSGDRIVVLAPHQEPETGSLKGFLHTFEWDGSAWVGSAPQPIDPNCVASGYAIALEGELLAVSCHVLLTPGVGSSSAVVIHRWMDGAWVQEHTVKSLGLAHGPNTRGPVIAIDEGVVAIGAYGYDLDSPYEGAVIIAKSEDGIWSESAIHQQAPDEPMGKFGFSVDIDGDTLVVGTLEGGFQHRTVFLYQWDGSQWNPEAELIAGPDTFAGSLPYEDGLGYEVAIDGDVIIACDRWNSLVVVDGIKTYKSVTYIYQRTGGQWWLKQRYLISDGGFQEKFGTQISIQGLTAIIGNNHYFDELDTPSAAFLINLCGADLNADGVTDAADLGIFLDEFGNPGGPTDINNDGVTDTADLGQLIASFGTACP